MIDPAAPSTVDHDDTASVLELVRSPITAIQAAAEILRDHHDLSQGERTAFLEALLVESERLEALVLMLLACRADAAELATQPDAAA